jgi:hypothetical protein
MFRGSRARVGQTAAVDDGPRRRLASLFGIDGTRAPMPPSNPRNRRIAAVLLAAFLVLNVLTASWLYVALAGLWLALILVREWVDHRKSP